MIVSLEEENLKKLYNTLAGLNYRLKIPIKKEDFIRKEKLQKLAEDKNMKVVSFYNSKDHFEIIDIGVNLPKITEILKRKKHIQIKDFTIPIIQIDDLIKMKEDLGRKQDLVDVENLKRIKKIKI